MIRSINCVLLFFVVCVLSRSILADDSFRTFTSADGQSISAKVVRYQETSEKVTLKRANGRKATIPVDSLSEADQDYL